MSAKYVIQIVADSPEAFEEAVESVRQSIANKAVSAHTAYYANTFGATMERIS